MTQAERLHEYLKVHKVINPFIAWRDLSIYRLAARVHDLRKTGVDIRSRDVKVTNAFGEKCSYAEYRLREVVED